MGRLAPGDAAIVRVEEAYEAHAAPPGSIHDAADSRGRWPTGGGGFPAMGRAHGGRSLCGGSGFVNDNDATEKSARPVEAKPVRRAAPPMLVDDVDREGGNASYSRHFLAVHRPAL